MIKELYQPDTVCTHCRHCWETVNRWWCGTHHRIVKDKDLPCELYEEYKGRGIIGGRDKPLKSQQQIEAEKAKLVDYIPLAQIKAMKAKESKQDKTNTKKIRQ